MNQNQINLLLEAIAASARLNATIAGMTAENLDRTSNGLAIAYPESAFHEVVEAEGLDTETFRGRIAEAAGRG